MKSDIDPIAEGYFKKLTSPSGKNYSSGKEDVAPSRWELNPIHKSLMRRRMDSEKIFDALPDLETIISVAVSSLLCTKDMVTTSLIYNSNPVDDDFPLEIKDALLQILRDFFNEEKRLPQRLYEWIYNAMAFSGSTPVMVVSESAIDKMFGLATEDFSSTENTNKIKSLLNTKGGFWGRVDGKPQLTVEGFTKPNVGGGSNKNSFNPLASMSELNDAVGSDSKINLIDDDGIAKLPKLRKSFIKRESFAERAAERFETSYNKEVKTAGAETNKERGNRLNPTYDERPGKVSMITVPTAKEAGRSSTHPMEIVLPAEAVIAITMPGAEAEPVAYLISYDNSGNALSLRTVGNLDNMFVNASGSTTDIVSSTARALGLRDDEISMTFPKLMEQYAELTERQFLKSLENGALGEGVSLAKNEEFYRVMAARHLAKRDTNVLCVPADQLAYFAVDLDVNGIGRSVIDRSKVISTARMVHLFATMRTMIENSSRRMLYTITLPEEERDGERAVALATHDITRKNNSFMPAWGDVDDVYAQVNNAGINIKVVGNEHYPSSDIEQSDITPDFKVPDKELDDMFIRRICAVARVDPDLILQPENIEFASQIWSKSLISAKQVIMKQQMLNRTITGHVRGYTYSSGILLDRMVDAIKSTITINEENVSKVPRWIRQFLDGLDVTLPQPDTTFTKSQMEQYNDKMEIIREIVEQCVTDSVADQVDMDVTKLRELLVSWYGITWLRNNGVETELIDLFLTEDDHRNIVKDLTDRHSIVGGLLLRIDKHFNSKMETVKKKWGEEELEEAGEFGGEFGEDQATDELGEGGDEFSEDLDSDNTESFESDEFDLDNEDSDTTEESEESEETEEGEELEDDTSIDIDDLDEELEEELPEEEK